MNPREKVLIETLHDLIQKGKFNTEVPMGQQSIYKELMPLYGKRMLDRVAESFALGIALTQETTENISECSVATITPMVDTNNRLLEEYADLYLKYKDLKRELEELKPIVKNDLEKLGCKYYANNGCTLEVINSYNTTKYGRYDKELIDEFIPEHLKEKIYETVVNGDVLEALILTDELPQELEELKNKTEYSYVSVRR